MPRTARVVIPDVFHHITHRGNNRQRVFFEDENQLTYLRLLGQYCRKNAVRVQGYCLMPNHVHLIVRPPTAESLAQAIGHAHGKYAQRVNGRYARTGHLWHSRFYSCPLDRVHFIRAMRYIERNPVRAGLVAAGPEYPWSSAAAHVGGPDTTGLLDLAGWKKLIGDLDWRLVLAKPDDDAELKRLRLHLAKGMPMGEEDFIVKLEKLVGQPLRPRPRGRPKLH